MFDIELIRRDDANIEMAFTDADGNIVDLTDSTIFFTVKKSLKDSDDDALIAKKITSHTDAVGGITTIALTPTDTNQEDGIYVWDIQLKDPSGYIFSADYGKLRIIQDVTIRTT